MELKRRIRIWRAERLRAVGMEGTIRLAAVFGVSLLAALLLDRFLPLSHSVRWGIFSAGSLGLAFVVYLNFIRPLRGLRAPRLLADVSERYPELKAFLYSAWELDECPRDPNTSSELAQAHIERTDLLVRSLPSDAVFSWRPTAGAARRLAFVAAAWGASLPLLYKGQINLQRVLAPWRDVSLEALVDVRPGDKNVSWAEPVVISAAWKQPSSENGLKLYSRREGGPWEAAPWDQEGAEFSSFRVESLVAPLEYRIGFKDMRSRIYRLTPIPYPRLTGIVVRVRLPGRDPVIREVPLEGGGEIAALRRSWVTLRGRPDRLLLSARLNVSYLGAPVEMKLLDSGEWEGGFPLNDNGTLRIELVAREGAGDPQPVAYALRALEDKLPEVQLLSPAFEVEISPKERLTLTYEARDDYGLSSLSLLYKVDAADEKVVTLEAFKSPPEQHLGSTAWDLSKFPVGSRIEFRIRAVDNNQPEAQTSVSNPGILHLVDFESMHAAADRRWLGAQESLRRLARREAEMADMLQEIAKAPTDALEERSKGLEPAENALDEAWSRTGSDMEEFSRAMRDDPYANPGMTETAGLLTKALKGLREHGLKAARSASRAKDWDQAAARHKQLESNLRKASELLEAGREMQAMQDFWGEAQRMDQASDELSGALDQIAKSAKKPDSKALEKLQEALGKLRGQMDAMMKAIDALPKTEPGSETDKNRKVYHVPLQAASKTADALAAALARGDYEEAARLARQLSAQLAKVQESIAQAAQSSAGGENADLARRMERMEKLWSEVVEQQQRSLGMTQDLEERKLEDILKAQKDLLLELARRQRDVIADSADLGPTMPADALGAMRRVLAEFERGRVEEAPVLLQSVIQRLQFRAMSYPRTPERESAEAAALLAVAAREADILERLSKGAAPPTANESRLSEMIAARAVQRQTRKKTEDLGGQLESFSRDAGMLPPEARDSVGQAQVEQESAETALGRGDSGAARVHQQKALDLLDKGRKQISQSLKEQQSVQQGSTRPFGGPRGMARRRGSTGADTGFVPLPRAEDYQPPREIRIEVEKSLRERRPPIFNEPVNEYLRRMSQ